MNPRLFILYAFFEISSSVHFKNLNANENLFPFNDPSFNSCSAHLASPTLIDFGNWALQKAVILPYATLTIWVVIPHLSLFPAIFTFFPALFRAFAIWVTACIDSRFSFIITNWIWGGPSTAVHHILNFSLFALLIWFVKNALMMLSPFSFEECVSSIGKSFLIRSWSYFRLSFSAMWRKLNISFQSASSLFILSTNERNSSAFSFSST